MIGAARAIDAGSSGKAAGQESTHGKQECVLTQATDQVFDVIENDAVEPARIDAIDVPYVGAICTRQAIQTQATRDEARDLSGKRYSKIVVRCAAPEVLDILKTKPTDIAAV